VKFNLTLTQFNSDVVKMARNSKFRQLKLLSVTRKTNSIRFKYFFEDVLILLADCMKDLAVTLYSKSYLHSRVAFVYSQ
jgi:hypothetical protein